MAKTISPLLPATAELLSGFGDRLRMARLRRRLTARQVAERAGMAPMTLRSLERGGSGVTIGAYLAVMQVLGLERDLGLLAAADPLGRTLQDARLPTHRAASVPSGSKPSTAIPTPTPSAAASGPVEPKIPPPRRSHSGSSLPAERSRQRDQDKERRWVEQGGFASSESLADLIAPPPTLKKGR
jgi:transcriptional regulator with XRE-family HTH domain